MFRSLVIVGAGTAAGSSASSFVEYPHAQQGTLAANNYDRIRSDLEAIGTFASGTGLGSDTTGASKTNRLAAITEKFEKLQNDAGVSENPMSCGELETAFNANADEMLSIKARGGPPGLTLETIIFLFSEAVANKAAPFKHCNQAQMVSLLALFNRIRDPNDLQPDLVPKPDGFGNRADGDRFKELGAPNFGAVVGGDVWPLSCNSYYAALVADEKALKQMTKETDWEALARARQQIKDNKPRCGDMTQLYEVIYTIDEVAKWGHAEPDCPRDVMMKYRALWIILILLAIVFVPLFIIGGGFCKKKDKSGEGESAAESTEGEAGP